MDTSSHKLDSTRNHHQSCAQPLKFTWPLWVIGLSLVVAVPSANAANLYLRSGSTCLYGGTSSQTLQTGVGTNQTSIPFNTASSTFSFYTTSLTNSVAIVASKKIGGTIGVQNNGPAGFQFKASATFYDYNPMTGSATQIAAYPTSAWSATIGPNGKTGLINLPQKKIGKSVSIPAGHVVRVDITVATSINSGINAALVYNASGGAGKSFVIFPNSGVVWPFGTAASTPNPSITAPSAVSQDSAGNLASVLNAGTDAVYSWTITNGTITAGQSSRQITWAAGSVGQVGIGVSIVNGCFSAASNRTVAVNLKADQTLAFDPIAPRTYGDPTINLSAVASSGLPITFSVISGPATISGTMLTISGAGEVVVNANQAGDTNWNPIVAQQAFTVTPKTLILSGITASNKVYDGTTTATLATNNVTLLGVIAGDSVSLDTTAATGDFADASVGTAKTVLIDGLDLSGPSAGNYTLLPSSTTADISTAPLTVSGIVANNKVYDGTTVAGLDFSSATLAGVVSGDTVSLDTNGASGWFSDKNAGSNKTVSVEGLVLGGTDAGNYAVSVATTATANITRASLMITANSTNKVYGQTLTFSGTEFSCNGLVAGDAVDSVTLNCSGAPASAPTGSYSIPPSSAVGSGLGNYNITYNNGALTINAPLRSTLSISLVGNGSISVTAAGGSAGQRFVLQSSTNLVNWSSVSTNLADSNGMFEFVDANARDQQCVFYRTVTP